DSHNGWTDKRGRPQTDGQLYLFGWHSFPRSALESNDVSLYRRRGSTHSPEQALREKSPETPSPANPKAHRTCRSDSLTSRGEVSTEPLSERSATSASERFLTVASGGATPLASSAWLTPTLRDRRQACKWPSLRA